MAERFTLLGVIGHGGSGTVYLAEDRQLERIVALKQLHPPLARQEESVVRFRSEAAVLASLSHPNVVAVYDYLEDGSEAWLAMEYVEGASLRDILRG